MTTKNAFETVKDARKEARANSGPKVVKTDTVPLRAPSDTRLKRLTSFGPTPGIIKPPEFELPPGTEVKDEDKMYWPNRFAILPEAEDYYEGDMVYSIHEDKSYTVLNDVQQTKEWQSANHLPPMNLLFIFGAEKDKTRKAEEKKEEKGKKAQLEAQQNAANQPVGATDNQPVPATQNQK